MRSKRQTISTAANARDAAFGAHFAEAGDEVLVTGLLGDDEGKVGRAEHSGTEDKECDQDESANRYPHAALHRRWGRG